MNKKKKEITYTVTNISTYTIILFVPFGVFYTIKILLHNGFR